MLKKLFSALKQGVFEFIEDDCMSQAAAVAYYTIFSLPPLLVLVFFLAEAAPIPQATVDRLLEKQLGVPLAESPKLDDTDQESSNRGEKSDQPTLLESVAERATESPGLMERLGPLSRILGGLLLAFTATGVFAQLQYGLNRVWGVEPDPEQGGVWSFLLSRLLSLGMIIVIGFLLLVSLVLTTLLDEVLRVIQGGSPGTVALVVGIVLNNVAAFVLATMLFAAMYLILPDAKMRWRDVIVGAAITAGLFVIGKALIGWYLQYSQVGSSWGSAAATMIGLLVWVYFSSLNVLFGAEMTQVWAKRFGDGIRPARGAVFKVEEKRHLR